MLLRLGGFVIGGEKLPRSMVFFIRLLTATVIYWRDGTKRNTLSRSNRRCAEYLNLLVKERGNCILASKDECTRHVLLSKKILNAVNADAAIKCAFIAS